MKRAALAVFASAALLVAQNVQDPKPDPRTELAEIIAVEQQEGDLAKAEKMYRSKIDSLGLSAEGRAYANLRLGSLLARLGRDDEAKPFLDRAAKANLFAIELAKAPQDVEREAKLREQARALILRVVKQRGKHWGPPLHGIDNTGVANQLLWLGDAAVPEVIAELQQQVVTVSSAGPVPYVTGLAGFLWHNGGDAAAEYLESCTKVENVQFREAVAKSAFQARSERMLQVAIRFLNDQDESGNVVRALMQSSSRKGPSLPDTLDSDVFVAAALQGPPAALKFSFTWGLKQRNVSPELLSQWHARVRQALKSTDPELGTAANEFLLSGTSQGSVEGIELLLERLPKMSATAIPQWRQFGGERVPFTEEQTRRLLPRLDACAKALGRADLAMQRGSWLQQMMWNVAIDHGPGCESELLTWIDLGYQLWPVLEGRIDMANAAEVVARIGGEHGAIAQALDVLRGTDELPQGVFPLLRAKAEGVRESVSAPRNPGVRPGGRPRGGRRELTMSRFAWPMVRTRHPEAADWILAEWQRKPAEWAVGPLVELGRHARTEKVRKALRAVAPDAANLRHDGRAVLALLAMGDEKTLDLVVETVHRGCRSRHPYAVAAMEDRPDLSPLGYLIYDQVDPPHGFSDEQVRDVLQRVTSGGIGSALALENFSNDAIADRHLMAMADCGGWIDLLVGRMVIDEYEESRRATFRDWCSRVLRSDNVSARAEVLRLLSGEDAGPFRAELEALLDGTDAHLARAAAKHLRSEDPKLDREWRARFARNRHAIVRSLVFGDVELLGPEDGEYIRPLLQDEYPHNRRMAADIMGAIVSKEAVPALIALLRDSEQGVRKAAEGALTRIRFYHEQQAHWDRVLKGMDASPASAAEKLLLQAKPGASKQQRILAIRSLGVLGRPEALPFLIEWTTDPDQEIAVQANTAITQIHLGAKKSGGASFAAAGLALFLVAGSTLAAQQADYVVLASFTDADPFDAAARHLRDHHQARLVRFDPGNLEPVRAVLTAALPRHVALVMRPEQIDFGFARQFLQLATEIDDDPFVDFVYGYITGANGDEATALARRGTSREPRAEQARIATVAGGVDRSFVRGTSVLLRLLGQAGNESLDIYCAGEKAFPDTGRDRAFLAESLPKLTGRDVITFVGHGWPREVAGGPDFSDLAGLELDNAVALNVACYTGVTGRYFQDDYRAGVVRQKEVPPAESFCLALLRTGVVGYTAYVCPRPAGPELDTDRAALIHAGLSLGEARRRDYDKTVLGYLGFGAERLDLAPPSDGQRVARNRDAVRDIMLEGATGGVLFGDPACVPFAAREGEDPLAITVEEAGPDLRLRARAGMTALYLQCADPTAKWGEGMSMRVYSRVPLGDRLVKDVVVDELKVGRDDQPSRVLWAVEDDHGERFLQVKVNFPRGERMLGGLSLVARIVTTTDAGKATLRGGAMQRPQDAALGAVPRDPFALASGRDVSREAVQAALDASAALLKGTGMAVPLAKLEQFESEGFRAVCVLLEAGVSHHRSWEMLKATWRPGDERHLIALASGPALPNYASWTVLRGLGVADTPAVRALLTKRLETEQGAGLFMSAAQGLALIGAQESAAAIEDRVLEFRGAWSGVEGYLIDALAELGGAEAIDGLEEIASNAKCRQWQRALRALERLDQAAADRVRAARGRR